jgi:hypothetical protein
MTVATAAPHADCAAALQRLLEYRQQRTFPRPADPRLALSVKLLTDGLRNLADSIGPLLLIAHDQLTARNEELFTALVEDALTAAVEIVTSAATAVRECNEIAADVAASDSPLLTSLPALAEVAVAAADTAFDLLGIDPPPLSRSGRQWVAHFDTASCDTPAPADPGWPAIEAALWWQDRQMRVKRLRQLLA